MLIGAQVRAAGGLRKALERGGAMGAEVVQVFTQSSRAWKPTQYAPDVLDAYRRAQAAHPTVRATYCHATYLINLATDDRDLFERSVACLAANLAVAEGLGASGLVLHVGSHRGAGLEGCLARIARALLDALEGAGGHCPILLENTAGAGGTVGRSFEELAAVLAAAGDHPRLGVCLDTQHLWASGVDFGDAASADRVVAHLEATVGIERLGCIHLNDSKVPLGANRDRHENLGEGTIGLRRLGALLGHPALGAGAAILEVPGEGAGPRAEDLATARRALRLGRAGRREGEPQGEPPRGRPPGPPRG